MCSAQHCLKIINWFIDLSLIALGLGCYVQAFSSCGARGLLFVSVCGHLIEVASLVMERGLLAHRLQSVGSVVVMHGLRCSMACGIFLTRDGATVPCIGRWILNHQIMREAQSPAPRKYYFSFVHVCSVTSVMSNSLWPQGLYVAHQAPLFMEFSRQEYWSGSPFPSPGDLLNPGIKPGSPALQADYLLSESPGKLILYKQCTVYMCVCIYLSIKSVQFSRSVMSDSLDCNIPGYPVHHHLPELL